MTWCNKIEIRNKQILPLSVVGRVSVCLCACELARHTFTLCTHSHTLCNVYAVPVAQVKIEKKWPNNPNTCTDRLTVTNAIQSLWSVEYEIFAVEWMKEKRRRKLTKPKCGHFSTWGFPVTHELSFVYTMRCCECHTWMPAVCIMPTAAIFFFQTSSTVSCNGSLSLIFRCSFEFLLLFPRTMGHFGN